MRVEINVCVPCYYEELFFGEQLYESEDFTNFDPQTDPKTSFAFFAFVKFFGEKSPFIFSKYASEHGGTLCDAT